MIKKITLQSVKRRLAGNYLIISIMTILALICVSFIARNVIGNSISGVIGNLLFLFIIAYCWRNTKKRITDLKSIKASLTLGK